MRIISKIKQLKLQIIYENKTGLHPQAPTSGLRVGYWIFHHHQNSIANPTSGLRVGYWIFHRHQNRIANRIKNPLRRTIEHTITEIIDFFKHIYYVPYIFHILTRDKAQVSSKVGVNLLSKLELIERSFFAQMNFLCDFQFRRCNHFK